MFKKKLNLRSCLSVLLFTWVGTAHSEAPKFPIVTELQGPVWLTSKEGGRQPLRRKQVLREKATLETGKAGFVKIQLDDKRRFAVLAESEITMPIIGWEKGEVPVLILKSGSLHWMQSLTEKSAYNTALSSELFEFIAPAGNFIYFLDLKKAYAEVKVFDGSIEFSALNGEESVLLKPAQKAGFQGVIEGGEIAYDVLLKGKKIPKGALTAVTEVDAKEFARVTDELKKHEQDKSHAKNKEKIAAAAKAKSLGFICTEPPAKFNQCAWVCLNNPKKEKKVCLFSEAKVSCVRRRCNANGEWAEETVINAQKEGYRCKAQPVVAPCDY